MKQKHYFDIKHKARPKNINPGDRVLLKQKKSTVDPPYNPSPFTVTSVKGNRLTMTDGKRRRVRDKNYVKPVRERKPARHIAHQSDSEYSEADIEIDVRGPAEENEVQAPDLNHPALPHPQVLAYQEPTVRDEAPEVEEEETEDELTARMRQLLAAAAAREVAAEGENAVTNQDASRGVTTRSRGVRLSWNPDMNSTKPLIELSDDEL